MPHPNSARCAVGRMSLAAMLLVFAAASPAFAQYTLNSVASFNGTDGATPQAGLILSGGTLYGTTEYGGATDGEGPASLGYGEVFSVPVTGGTPTILTSFNGTSDGAYPLADLTLSGTTLYGTTSGGGASGNGEVFSIPTSAVNGTPTGLGSFNGTTTGAGPGGGLILSGSTLYGTTGGGGASGDGEVFSLPITGGTPNVLGSFTGTANGSGPGSDLILSGTTLYGTTRNGGANSDGAVFSESISGGTPVRLASFNRTDGQFPESSLVLSGGTLYGTTGSGGGNGVGVVFSLPVTGGTPNDLTSFTQIDGSSPDAGLILSGSTLFGTTENSITSFGEVFSIPTSGGTPNILAQLNSTDGEFPVAPLVMDSSGNLYGTASQGGTGGNAGAVFVLSVPEPTSASLLAISALALLRRSGRHKNVCIAGEKSLSRILTKT
jgi:uncharacterized repeat protein (TIGR03803 family)